MSSAAASDGSTSTSILVALFVECIIYGMFILLFGLTWNVLLKKRQRSSRGTTPLLGVSTAMFILATFHVGIGLKRAMNKFLLGIDISTIFTASYLLKSAVYTMQTLVGDGFMIYRVYLVWTGDKRVVIPLLVCFMADIATGVGTLRSLAVAKNAATRNAVIELNALIATFFSLTLVINVVCTVLIAGRIWVFERATRNTTQVFGNRLRPAILLIIESGAIYSVALILVLVYFSIHSFAQYIVLDPLVPIIGAVFTMVIVRVRMDSSSEVTNSAIPPVRPVSDASPDIVALELSPRGLSVETSEVKNHTGSENV
ncbi:hypothetical protein HMN09_00108200 [Mycena chlorophos]|uniref:Uncharacterized protein n=1 Tax=Mycena chlorophos TaxID=658473 RepID=A0A8H6WSQ1_MYCCL|nr:hypothetical protein HMN09_00108200 [Mycena chlorophos]